MREVRFKYLNHRGEVRERRVLPISLDFQKNPGYSYQPGWFLTCHDLDENGKVRGVRSFALTHILLNDPDSLIPDFFRLKLED